VYKNYFELAEIPFKIIPDPRFLWYSDQHSEAKDKLLYHLTESAGPIYLLAEVGTGKSTIARRILQELSHDTGKQVVYVYAPKLPTTNAFLRFVMDEFKVKTDRAYDRSLRNFENYLVEQHQKGTSPILLIDEAQNMNRDMLLLIQHLFNFSTNDEFLIQIALFAQPELQIKLKRLPSLQSRLSIARLKPFDREQTEEMMRFRWTVAGGENFPFEAEAIDQIYKFTKGIPRLIVQLANEALIKTAVDQRKQVNQESVVAGWNELAFSPNQT
jgi:general secretion pathway protein A